MKTRAKSSAVEKKEEANDSNRSVYAVQQPLMIFRKFRERRFLNGSGMIFRRLRQMASLLQNKSVHGRQA